VISSPVSSLLAVPHAECLDPIGAFRRILPCWEPLLLSFFVVLGPERVIPVLAPRFLITLMVSSLFHKDGRSVALPPALGPLSVPFSWPPSIPPILFRVLSGFFAASCCVIVSRPLWTYSLLAPRAPVLFPRRLRALFLSNPPLLGPCPFFRPDGVSEDSRSFLSTSQGISSAAIFFSPFRFLVRRTVVGEAGPFLGLPSSLEYSHSVSWDPLTNDELIFTPGVLFALGFLSSCRLR